jgi:hypothetical protein
MAITSSCSVEDKPDRVTALTMVSKAGLGESSPLQAWMRRLDGCVGAGRFEDSGAVRCVTEHVEVEEQQSR